MVKGVKMQDNFKVIRNIGYGLIKQNVMRDRTLSIEAKAIYSYLCGFSGTSGRAYPLVKTMLEELNISKNRYYKYLNELIDRKIVIVEKNTEETRLARNVYYITDDETEDEITKNTVKNDDECLQNEDEVSLQNKDIDSNSEDLCLQNEDIVSLQNEDIVSLQNEDTEKYQRKLIYKNNIYTPPISPPGESAGVKNKNNNPGDSLKLKADKAIKAITPKKDIQDVIKDFAGCDLEMIDALKEFYKSRTAFKKPLTARALRLNLNALVSLSSNRDEQLAIVNQTIQKGWKSFYQLPKNHPLRAKDEVNENEKYGFVF